MASDDWYYAAGGQQQGPVSLEALRGMLWNGQVQPGDLVWCEGMPTWTDAASVPVLANAIPAAADAQSPGAQPAGGVDYASPAGYAAPSPYGDAASPGQLGYFNTSMAHAPPTNYAGFWLRFVAFIIDYIILYIPSAAIQWGLGMGMQTIGGPGGVGVGGGAGGGGAPPPAFYGLIATSITISIALNWLYYAYLESSPKQATIGKMALGLVVTDLYGKRLTFGRATGRYFGRLLSGLICYIGFIMAAFTEKKQALHDQLAATLVVRKQ